METKVKQTFEELFKIQENNHCFECGENADTWASVNNGIFLCNECATAHQKFGVNVSSIRKISDPWSDFHLSMMVNGGNMKLRDFFDKYYIPKDGPMNFKYRTKAGYYYRNQLRALCEGTILPEPLDANDALELETNADPNELPEYERGYSATVPEEESGLNKMKSFLGKQFKQTVDQTKERAKHMNERLQESNFVAEANGGMKIVTDMFVQESKNIASFVSGKVQNANVGQNVKDIGSKIGATAKSGWMGALGMFQKLTGKEEPQPTIIEGNLETVYSVENPTSISEPVPAATEQQQQQNSAPVQNNNEENKSEN